MDYKKITPDRYSDVIRHLRETFFVDEPLNKAANLCAHGEGNKELELHSIATLEDNLSIMVVNKDDEIAGVILNGAVHVGDIEKSQEKLRECPDENFKKIFNLLYDANLQNDLFEYFNVDQIFDSRILSVDSRFRGQGIAKELMKRTEELAKSKGYEIIKGDATGIYSQKILKGLGFQKISEIFYDEYVDEMGEVILNVAEPHKSLQVMYKRLD